MPQSTNRRNDPEEWTTKAFLDHFLRIHHQMDDRRFAFILGAGASVTSGVPSGAELVDRWLADLHTRDSAGDGTPIDQWATDKTLDIENFKYSQRAEFYPQIYHRRFVDDPAEGYADLEEVMKKAHPGLGYSMLAQILGETRHKMVITTNFDNLVADAVLLFTDTFAQTCGHESLTGYVGVQPRRPLIAKIHRDLLLGPQNDPFETEFLHENWAGTLRRIFATYTPLVIGYGGNDGSLMNFLYSLKPNTIPGTLFWFCRGERPNKWICKLVARQSGKLVSIADFDQFMTQLAEPLGFGLLDAEIEKRAGMWAGKLRDEWDRAKKASAAVAARRDKEIDKEASKQVRETFDRVETQRARKKDDWWAWELRARREADLEKREAIYRQALVKLPNSAELNGNFAVFMLRVRKNYDEAEQLYRRALSLDPQSAVITGNFAVFMQQVRKNYDEAEQLYRRALELDPENATNTGNFANFMYQVRKDYDEAQRLYRRALDLDPEYAPGMGNFASFLYEVRKDYDEAEWFYRRALDLDPEDADYTGNFANFMWRVRKDYDEAERLYRRALELESDHASNTGNFANFMYQARKEYDEAERLYRRALELDPEDATNTGNFAGFLLARKRCDEARAVSDRAWTLAKGEPSQDLAELTLYRGLLLLGAEKSDASALGRLKTLFQTDFLRVHWSFDDVLSAAGGWLSQEDAALYRALADAILDESKVAALDAFPRWSQVDPIPLDQAWEDLGD